MKGLGIHLLIDLYGCDPKELSEVDAVREILRAAVTEARATIVTDHFHQFQPYGVSGVIVISESHATIHTWPEKHCAAVDLFTCSETVDTKRLIRVLTERFRAEETTCTVLDRGVRLPETEASVDYKESGKWRPADLPKSSS